eukprot:CAMPEP_0114665530 /NCGR_PEP_ID=MMETSP0191-20121206/30878_1 /TAXON_ID=126664 /ORGANISM="Sorites sp." /LENGTH=80 /DNA_ID=CAMNT_0001910721 /DNA_START=28 /DNA_END=270 /DNA_ORIENTATION=+
MSNISFSGSKGVSIESDNDPLLSDNNDILSHTGYESININNQSFIGDLKTIDKDISGLLSLQKKTGTRGRASSIDSTKER